MEYRRRLIDEALDQLFPELSAIALEGAKGVGKTATAAQRARTIYSLDRSRQRESIAADPEIIYEALPPVLIDEWQLVPEVWESVRRAVDEDPTGGKYLLAGSADVPPNVRLHSGAGRIVSFPMRPLSFYERGLEEPRISLAELMVGSGEIARASTDVRLTDYVEEILRSGFPGIRDLSERARKVQLNSYIDRAINKEVPESGAQVRRPDALRSWLTAYAAATASDSDYTTILNATTPLYTEKPARNTVDAYREHLTRIFLLDPLEPWTPAFVPLQRRTKRPKHHLVDPALAARLVGLDKAGILQGGDGVVSPLTGSWLRNLFESLVTQSVRVYADHHDARTYHLRTVKAEHEVDLIVENEDLSVVGIEVKLASSIRGEDVKNLHWLENEVGNRLRSKVVLYTGPQAHRRPDGVNVIPFALLGP